MPTDSLKNCLIFGTILFFLMLSTSCSNEQKVYSNNELKEHVFALKRFVEKLESCTTDSGFNKQTKEILVREMSPKSLDLDRNQILDKINKGAISKCNGERTVEVEYVKFDAFNQAKVQFKQKINNSTLTTKTLIIKYSLVPLADEVDESYRFFNPYSIYVTDFEFIS